MNYQKKAQNHDYIEVIKEIYKNSSVLGLYQVHEILANYSIFEDILQEKFHDNQFMIRLLVSLKYELIPENKKVISLGKKGGKCYFLLEGEVAKITLLKKTTFLTYEEYITYLNFLLSNGQVYLAKKIAEENSENFPIIFEKFLETFLKKLNENDSKFLTNLVNHNKSLFVNICNNKNEDNLGSQSNLNALHSISSVTDSTSKKELVRASELIDYNKKSTLLSGSSFLNVNSVSKLRRGNIANEDYIKEENALENVESNLKENVLVEKENEFKLNSTTSKRQSVITDSIKEEEIEDELKKKVSIDLIKQVELKEETQDKQEKSVHAHFNSLTPVYPISEKHSETSKKSIVSVKNKENEVNEEEKEKANNENKPKSSRTSKFVSSSLLEAPKIINTEDNKLEKKEVEKRNLILKDYLKKENEDNYGDSFISKKRISSIRHSKFNFSISNSNKQSVVGSMNNKSSSNKNFDFDTKNKNSILLINDEKEKKGKVRASYGDFLNNLKKNQLSKLEKKKKEIEEKEKEIEAEREKEKETEESLANKEAMFEINKLINLSKTANNRKSIKRSLEGGTLLEQSIIESESSDSESLEMILSQNTVEANTTIEEGVGNSLNSQNDSLEEENTVKFSPKLKSKSKKEVNRKEKNKSTSNSLKKSNSQQDEDSRSRSKISTKLKSKKTIKSLHSKKKEQVNQRKKKSVFCFKPDILSKVETQYKEKKPVRGGGDKLVVESLKEKVRNKSKQKKEKEENLNLNLNENENKKGKLEILIEDHSEEVKEKERFVSFKRGNTVFKSNKNKITLEKMHNSIIKEEENELKEENGSCELKENQHKKGHLVNFSNDFNSTTKNKEKEKESEMEFVEKERRGRLKTFKRTHHKSPSSLYDDDEEEKKEKVKEKEKEEKYVITTQSAMSSSTGRDNKKFSVNSFANKNRQSNSRSTRKGKSNLFFGGKKTMKKSSLMLNNIFLSIFGKLTINKDDDEDINYQEYLSFSNFKFKNPNITLEQKTDKMQRMEYYEYFLVEIIEKNDFFGDEYLECQDYLQNVTYITLKPSSFLSISKGNYERYLKMPRFHFKEEIIKTFSNHFVFRGFSLIGFFTKFFIYFKKKTINKREKLVEAGKKYDDLYFLTKGKYEVSSNKSIAEVCLFLEKLSQGKIKLLENFDSSFVESHAFHRKFLFYLTVSLFYFIILY